MSQAVADANRAIALNPNAAIAYNDRAVAYERQGFRNWAIADYRAALRANPALQLARDGLSRLDATP